MKAFAYLWQYFVEIVLEVEMFQAVVVAKIKTHILSNLFPEKRAVYEIIWKTLLEPGRPQMTI